MEMLRIKGRSDKVIYYTQLCHFYIEDCSFNNACVNGIRVQVILFSYLLCFIFMRHLESSNFATLTSEKEYNCQYKKVKPTIYKMPLFVYNTHIRTVQISLNLYSTHISLYKQFLKICKEFKVAVSRDWHFFMTPIQLGP